MHLPPLPRFLFRWSVRLALVAIFLGLPLALFYLRSFGVGRGLADRVAEALSGREYRTSIGRLTFDPFRGLVAEDVDVIETTPDERRLAHLARLIVSIDLGNLISRKVTVDFLELDKTEIRVPLGSDREDGSLLLTDVNAQAIMLGSQLRISYFEARVAGLRVILSGLLQNPQAFHPQKAAAGPSREKQRDALHDWLTRLDQLHFEGSEPELRAEINGDLADTASIRIAPISLHAGAVSGDGWRFTGVEAGAQYIDGVFTLSQFVLRDEDGRLTLNATYSGSKVDFEISSGVRPDAFLQLFPADSPVRDFSFSAPARIDAFGSIDLHAVPLAPNVTGKIRCGEFSFRQVRASSLSVDFAWRDGRFFARDLDLAAGGGRLSADIMLAPGDFRARLLNTIKPTVFAPIFGEKERAFLDLMEFKENPRLEIEVQGSKPGFDAIRGSGTIKLGRTALRGSWLDSGNAKIEVGDRAVTYRDFTINVGKGVGTGTFVYDFGRQEVRLQNIESTLVPVDVLMWIDPKIADVLRPYRFHQPPHVEGSGVVHMRTPEGNNLSLKIAASDGLDYDLLNKTLKFGRTTASVDIIDAYVHANVIDAQLMGGAVGIKAIVFTEVGDPSFQADVDLRRVDFDRLTKLYFDYDSSEGVVTGTYSFKAQLNDASRMRGHGTIRVEDGHVLAIPVLGPLSEILNKIIPGSGFETARVATADFEVADQKISTPNLAIEGLGFTLIGHGDIYFMTDRMDMSVRINARGVPGIVLFPVSKLFEYVSTGSISRPEWRPKLTHFTSGDKPDDPPPSQKEANKNAPDPAVNRDGRR